MKKKKKKMREKKESRRLRVSLLVKRRMRQFHGQGKRYHILWYPQRKTRSNT